MNLPTLLFENLRDIVRDIRDGSKRTKSYIPLGRLISNILMENQLIDSLTDDQFIEGMKLMAGKLLNTKGLKKMGIITDVIIPLIEMPKDMVHNKRIPLEDFLVFSTSYSLNDVVKFWRSVMQMLFLLLLRPTRRRG